MSLRGMRSRCFSALKKKSHKSFSSKRRFKVVVSLLALEFSYFVSLLSSLFLSLSLKKKKKKKSEILNVSSLKNEERSGNDERVKFFLLFFSSFAVEGETLFGLVLKSDLKGRRNVGKSISKALLISINVRTQKDARRNLSLSLSLISANDALFASSPY